MKANNGVLIIDDFGRQRVRPEELLNRWVVPLDRKIDFLTLAGGRKIEIPFELFVVFATNLDPTELVDTAFLRRIQTKVRVEIASERQFSEIFRRFCHDTGLVYDAGLIDELMDPLQNRLKEPLRPCYPRDLVNQITWTARYEGREARLDRASLIRAVEAISFQGAKQNRRASARRTYHPSHPQHEYRSCHVAPMRWRGERTLTKLILVMHRALRIRQHIPRPPESEHFLRAAKRNTNVGVHGRESSSD